MFVDRTDDASIGAAIDAGVSAYVVDGLKKERIKPILGTAIHRFRAKNKRIAEIAEILLGEEESASSNRAFFQKRL